MQHNKRININQTGKTGLNTYSNGYVVDICYLLTEM